MPPLQLRDAHEDDRATIADLTLRAYEEYAGAAFWESYRRTLLTTLADIGAAEQIVAEHAGRMVGTVLLYPANTLIEHIGGVPLYRAHPEVRLLAVLPEARGQGVGGALVHECIRRTRVAGAPVLTIHTTDMMQTARRMYEQIGFLRAPELDFRPDSGILVMGFRLPL